MKNVVSFFLFVIASITPHLTFADPIIFGGSATISGVSAAVTAAPTAITSEPGGTQNVTDVNKAIALKRTWTCHATVFLTGSTYAYTFPSWRISGGMFEDRQKSCLKYIKEQLLDSSIWNYFPLTLAEENSYCQSGEGQFRIDYGFDKRPKNWTHKQNLATPRCDCEVTCPPGWGLDGGGRCATGVCGPVDLPNQEHLEGMSGLYIWRGYIYQAQPPVIGDCFFDPST
jgi:hypothetical protein